MQEPPVHRKVFPNREHKCQYCGVMYFSRSNNSKYCSPKCRESSRYERDRDKISERKRQYRKKNADRIRVSKRRYYEENRLKISLQNRRNYLRDRDARLAYAKAYQKNHPEVSAATRNKRRKAPTFDVTGRDLLRIQSRYSNSCFYCGVTLKPQGRSFPESLQWDHVIPLSRDGVNSIGNIVPSCRNCNRSKSDRFVTEWRFRERT